MLHFGRSGTGLMHSLIDAHPEISTLPSLYLAGYFNNGVWEHLSQGPVEQLPERFADMFAVLFDASSLVSVPGALRDGLSQIGVQEGMTTVGDNRDEILKVDRNLFCSEARRLMAGLGNIDTGIFLRIVHAAYEHALATKTDRHTLFYHIHNPTSYTTLNFLSQMPDARFLMMVREPLQSLESWLKDPAREHDYGQIVLYILTMIYGIDRVPFRQHDSIGVRLEDLKSRPKPTMQSLCNWIGITETPSLYEMTAQGKKWWGDPTSPDYDKKKEMSPFDDTCFKRPPGTLLGDRDRLLLKTLFHPFSVRFGYAEDDPDTFSTSLSEARAILHEPLQFEQKIIEQTNADPDLFCKRGDYLMLRAALGDRLDVLDELGTYPHMLTPLTIEQDG